MASATIQSCSLPPSSSSLLFLALLARNGRVTSILPPPLLFLALLARTGGGYPPSSCPPNRARREWEGDERFLLLPPQERGQSTLASLFWPCGSYGPRGLGGAWVTLTPPLASPGPFGAGRGLSYGRSPLRLGSAPLPSASASLGPSWPGGAELR